jgi:hypothetical protein
MRVNQTNKQTNSKIQAPIERLCFFQKIYMEISITDVLKFLYNSRVFPRLYEEFCLLEYDAMQSIWKLTDVSEERRLTFNVLYAVIL